MSQPSKKGKWRRALLSGTLSAPAKSAQLRGETRDSANSVGLKSNRLGFKSSSEKLRSLQRRDLTGLAWLSSSAE